MLKNCKVVYGCVPKMLKSNIQFVVDMQNYFSPQIKDRQLKFYDDCGQWDYKSKNYVVTYHLKSFFLSLCFLIYSCFGNENIYKVL